MNLIGGKKLIFDSNKEFLNDFRLGLKVIADKSRCNHIFHKSSPFSTQITNLFAFYKIFETIALFRLRKNAIAFKKNFKFC